MRILKWIMGALCAVVLLLVALGIGARFGDGPTAILPGGPLEAGEIVTGAEPDWTKDVIDSQQEEMSELAVDVWRRS